MTKHSTPQAISPTDGVRGPEPSTVKVETSISAYAFLIGTSVVLRALRAIDILDALADVRKADSKCKHALRGGDIRKGIGAYVDRAFASARLVNAVGMGSQSMDDGAPLP